MSSSDRSTLLERIGRACATHVWIKLLAIAVLVGATILLLQVSGGFPPTAWVFLIQIIPLLPCLWRLRGAGILLPLSALTGVSASLAMAWVILLRFGWLIARSWRQSQRTPVSSSATMRTQVSQQEQEAEASSPPLKVRGDERGSVTAAQQECTEEHIVDTAPSPLPTSASSCNVPSFDAEGPSLAQPFYEAADSDLKVGACIHLAQGQPWKEDALFVSQEKLDELAQTRSYGLFVVADGLGGHQLTGHDACQLAIGSLTSHILQTFSETEAAVWDEQNLMVLVIESLQQANLTIFQCNQEHQAYLEVSMVVCLVIHAAVYGASIGETRTYLYRESSGLLQMTRDDVGGTEAQFLGERTQPHIDSFTQFLQQEDRLLLCTDGLWKFVRDPDIARIMSIAVSDSSQTSNALIQTALEGGSEDHIGVVVVQFLPTSANVEIPE